jgi:hypothetical protein
VREARRLFNLLLWIRALLLWSILRNTFFERVSVGRVGPRATHGGLAAWQGTNPVCRIEGGTAFTGSRGQGLTLGPRDLIRAARRHPLAGRFGPLAPRTKARRRIRPSVADSGQREDVAIGVLFSLY